MSPVVYLEDNPTCAREILRPPFLEIHAPKRKRKVINNYTPWLTPELKRLMFEMDKLKRAAISNNSDAHWTEYKILKKCKCEYLTSNIGTFNVHELF